MCRIKLKLQIASAGDTLFFIDVVRPPELLQFVGDVIPILYGERAFAHHHNSHGDVVVGAIDMSPSPTLI